MSALQHVGAAAPDTAALERPTSDEARAVAAAPGFQEQTKNDGSDCRATPRAGQALQVIEGERQAERFLDRLHNLQADPDELAQIVAQLYGATLRGFCSVLVKALGGNHA
jgi:hypothetical protein